jgi:sporulation protein YlmC with PRC-barrel domain
MRLDLGKTVRCTDGVYGELADVVIDPIEKRVTHLVVNPTRRDTIGSRLVPIELASGGEEREISLACPAAEVDGLDTVEEFAYLRLGEPPLNDPDWDVGVRDVLATPYYEGSGFGGYGGDFGAFEGMTYDRIPKGEIEIRRSSPVFSEDGHHLGHVEGFVVDADDHISHLVLERGHLWGRRDVTIPIGSVAKVANDEVTVSLSKDDVGALKAVRVHRWGSHRSSADS